jgi:hypothetical protein
MDCITNRFAKQGRTTVNYANVIDRLYSGSEKEPWVNILRVFSYSIISAVVAIVMICRVHGQGSTNPRDNLPFTNTSLTNVKPDLPTLFICGDSTAANGNPRQRGWDGGALVIDYFDTNKINLANYSLGGINFPTYYISRGPQVVAALKPGDFNVVELGA